MVAFGGASSFDSQPWGGLGGGEMKNSFLLSGACRCWSTGSTGVCSPKYTRARSPMIDWPSRARRTVRASSVEAKEQAMRRKDLRGDHDVVGAVVSMPERSWAR